LETKALNLHIKEMNPFIRAAAINLLAPGFDTGYRKIYHYQLQYIQKGQGEVDIEGTIFNASKGDLFMWGPGEEHRVSSNAHHPLTILGVQFDFTQNHSKKKYPLNNPSALNFNENLVNEVIKMNHFKGFPHHIRLISPISAEMILIDIAKEFKTQKIFCEEKISALLKVFLLTVARQIQIDDTNTDSQMELVENVLNYIHVNFSKSLTNKDIGAAFHFHPNYINKLLTATTGMSLHEYVIHVRLNRAVELLNTTNMTISEISSAVGFDTIHHFSSIFKKKMGYPPSDI